MDAKTCWVKDYQENRMFMKFQSIRTQASYYREKKDIFAKKNLSDDILTK